MVELVCVNGADVLVGDIIHGAVISATPQSLKIFHITQDPNKVRRCRCFLLPLAQTELTILLSATAIVSVERNNSPHLREEAIATLRECLARLADT